ncbi:RNA-directed DNA polymerase (reverse transcriptase)-related family protein [Rhynchospora pubera]|uniref:RNA-directed DNA polymerase (Reverse transcriptase)-related family protein n=1 Tax=Rhynchospora pubera TaxID=906938 RepID=A0AAV8H0Q0_9POAL|nr:RNA-directed DNA polymerase (reverse transcriptase)-related family protein [Rhynchospora pubera]
MPLVHASSTATQQLQALSLQISSLRLSSIGLNDDFIWRLNSINSFSVNSLYKLQKAFPKPNSSLASIWNLKIPPRMKIFMWRLAQDRLATLDNLKRRGWHLPNRCCMCNSQEETSQHLFNDCSFFLQTIHFAKSASNMLVSVQCVSMVDFILDSSANKTHRELPAILSFVIWRQRCARIFEGVMLSASELVFQAFFDWQALNNFNSL